MKFFEKINKKLALIIFVVMIVISIAGVAVYGIISENMRNIEVANKKLEEDNNNNDNNSEIKYDSNGNPIVVALDEPILDDDVINGETTTEEKNNEEKKEDNNKNNQQQTTTVKTTTAYYIKVNIAANVVTIYKKDRNGDYTVPVKAMICSTGEYTPPRTSKYPGTVYKMPGWRRRWQALQGNVYGQYATQIVGNILFHSVPYTAQNNSSLEWWEYDKLGTYASAGCIRLTVTDAKWIYENVGAGTAVEFYSSSNPGPLGKPQTKKISSNIENRGWDPTDTDPNNPWKKVKEEPKVEEQKPEEKLEEKPNTNTVVNEVLTNSEVNNTNSEVNTNSEATKPNENVETNTVKDTKVTNTVNEEINKEPEVKEEKLTVTATISFTKIVSNDVEKNGVKVVVNPKGGSNSYKDYTIKLYLNNELIKQDNKKELFVDKNDNGTYKAEISVTDSKGNKATNTVSVKKS